MSNAEFNQEIKKLHKYIFMDTNGYSIVVKNSILSKDKNSRK